MRIQGTGQQGYQMTRLGRYGRALVVSNLRTFSSWGGDGAENKEQLKSIGINQICGLTRDRSPRG